MSSNANLRLPVYSIDTLRVGVDGGGIRTLVAVPYCPLSCRYCINDYCHNITEMELEYFTADELYNNVNRYRLYYLSSGGGVTFGGGEPLLYENFLLYFCEKYASQFSICIETSLNVKTEHLEKIVKLADLLIVDIKDMNPVIYKAYTGHDNSEQIKNLDIIKRYPDKAMIRIPHIKDYNIDADVRNSKEIIKKYGFTNIEEFTYFA